MVDTFSETCLVAIQKTGSNAVEFYSISETVKVEVGEKPVDFIAILNGGRLAKFSPQEPTTITLEAYPVEAGTDSGTTGNGFFDLLGTADASEPLSIPLDRVRTKVRCTILWCDDTTVTNATSAINIGQTGLRVVAKDGYVTKVSPGQFTPSEPNKWTVEMKFPPFDKDGTACVTIASSDGTATSTINTSY